MRRRHPTVQKPHLKASKSEPRSEPPDHAGGAIPTIIFTGNRGNDRYQIIVHGSVVELSLSCLNTVMDLVIARGEAGTGFVLVNAVAICRLRKALDDAVGPGTGHALVETGNAEEYRLGMPRDQMTAKLAITVNN